MSVSFLPNPKRLTLQVGDRNESYDIEDEAGLPSHHFEGDFFGDSYHDEDFPWDGNSNDSLLDDSEAESESEHEIALEPPPPPGSSSPDEDEDNDLMDDHEHGRLMTVQERENMAGTQRLHPVIEHFPSWRAGEIVSHQSQLGYSDYASDLGDNGVDNPYAPFISKVDWEFVRWAKLRGAGSTAVSELMGIEGVSLMLTSLTRIFNFCSTNRYMRSWGYHTRTRQNSTR
jgi:hypothetical protein